MDDILVAQLKAQHERISHFRALSGSPALSLGVFHHGKVIHTAHFGRKDESHPDPPDDDSVLYVASLLKILTVSAISKLVRDGLLGWDVPVREYLPEFQRDDDVGRLTTLRDLIANRTGLAVATFYWSQQHGQLLLEKSEMIRFISHMKAAKPFRKSFLYSQWNYCLVQIVIERVTGKLFSDFIHEYMIAPLGLTNTTFDIPKGRNLVLPHAVRDDGTATRIHINPWCDESGITAGAGGKSSLSDLLTMYIKLLAAYNHQRTHEVDITPDLPFTDLRTIFTPQINVSRSKERKQDYCLGLYRTQLPGNLSIASWNQPLFGAKIPTFGEGLPDVEIFHHTMGIPGFLGSMFLVPHSNSGVVVLSNATPKLDATDLAAQCLLGVLLGDPCPDLLRVAKEGLPLMTTMYKQISSMLEQGRTDTPPSLPLQMYTGFYINSAGNFFLQVSETEDGLLVTVQGNSRITYNLMPYDEDTFYWPINRDKELCEKSMWPLLIPTFHIVTFGVEEGNVLHLEWHHDTLAGPEIFMKDTTRSKL